MKKYSLNIGDVVASSSTVSYSCYGLGSCVGVFIQDRLTGISGGAHAFLPADQTGPCMYSPFCSVTNAIDEILRQMQQLGSSLLFLRAKVAGGANLFEGKYGVGQQNARSVMKELMDRKIFVAAQDLGGSHCRSVRFESNTGLLFVSKPQINQHQTY